MTAWGEQLLTNGSFCINSQVISESCELDISDTTQKHAMLSATQI